MATALFEIGYKDVGVLFILHVTIFQMYHFLSILHNTMKFLNISTAGNTALEASFEKVALPGPCCMVMFLYQLHRL
jgi:fumarate reductase subunit D